MTEIDLGKVVMRGVVDVQVTGERPPAGQLSIRIAQGNELTRSRWVWALVEVGGPNDPDRIIRGGTADSITECAAIGEQELREEEARRVKR